MKSFYELNLPVHINKALEAMRFEVPTPIQVQAIPSALTKRDLIGCAQTGTGKTAAFCIPLLVRLYNNRDKTGLILVPTRELARQIEVFWQDLTKFAPEARCATLIGGMSMQPQRRALSKKPLVVIATPGRLIDHLNRGSLSLSKAEILVLDEADRMLDMGFAPQLNQILRYLPKCRQTMLFSATWNKEVDQLAAKYLKEPVRITAGGISTPPKVIEQTTVVTTAKQKNETLLDQLNQRNGSVLIFARTQARTDRLAHYLASYGLDVNRIHGGRTQGQRNSALQRFRTGEVRILVATDIAARGIDVANIAHVINYDLPQVAEDYVHRIGRTARAGASGQATSLLTPDDQAQWREILNLLKRAGSQIPQNKTEERKWQNQVVLPKLKEHVKEPGRKNRPKNGMNEQYARN